ncbi:hypothetical protein SCB49_04925 [unidentified eubacterium SCB49]|nr:hypothetical protein SCB49_04925 [unidentified eubacterium SCB49]
MMLLLTSNAFAQITCGEVTTNEGNNGDPITYRTTSSQSNQSYLQNSYCIKVYFHIVKNTDGDQAQPDSKASLLMNQLEIDYSPHNIYFEWDGTIDYVVGDAYYNNLDISIFSHGGFDHSDGVDIFLFPDDTTDWGGIASGVGVGSALLLGGEYQDDPSQPVVDTPFISHEMGHILGLWHTFHGTWLNNDENGGDPNGTCQEYADGSNGDTCGDYIEDTPADPNINFEINPDTCEWTLSNTDGNGDPYMPSTNNYMAYTHPECMDSFTPLQVQTMRSAIDTLPHLQNLLVDNCCATAVPDGDLYIKDSVEDNGLEPNTVTEHMWLSKDIWIRNVDDDGITHQNPEYNANGTPNYIYVRVINRSCDNSEATEDGLTVNWAKANTSLTYPQYWDGTLTNGGGYPLGGVLTTVDLPSIPANDEVIVKVPWVIPNPDNYSDSDNPWHFCLIAAIDTDEDPLPMHTPNPNVMVGNQNNRAWKNLTVVDLKSGFTKASVMVANPKNSQRTFSLEFLVESTEQGKAVYNEAEVNVTMDDTLYDIWERGGKQKASFLATKDKKTRRMQADGAILDNLVFNANERALLTLDFNMLIKEQTPKNKYTLHVIQKDKITGEVMGGETFEVYKEIRDSFAAVAGNDAAIDTDQTVTLSPEQINEAATYNWYDPQGNLIHQGTNLTVTAAMAKTYTLEVIADADGFKDYDEVEVSIKPSRILTISPNPVTQNEVHVNYKLNNVTSAYLMIVDQNSGVSQNYILDPTTSAATITLDNYTSGLYTIALVCDSEIMNAYNFIKQ